MSLANPDPSKLFDADKIKQERKGPTPDRQLDAKCAEIMGWTEVKMPVGLDLKPTGHYVGIPPTCGGKVRWDDVSVYSTSLDAARELLEWAEKKCATSTAKERQFSEIILNRLGMNWQRGWDEMIWHQVIPLLLATPRQICEAFVETFGGHDDRP